MAPSHGFRLRRSGRLVVSAPQSRNPPSQSGPSSRFVTFWRLCDASWSPPLFPRSLQRPLARPSGLAIATLPLVSRPWTVLRWPHLMSLSSVVDRLMVVPSQLIGSGVCSPASTICPPSSFMKQHPFGFSASISLRVFAIRSPFRVESFSDLDRNEDSSRTFPRGLVPSLRDGVTLIGSCCVFLRTRSERRLVPSTYP